MGIFFNPISIGQTGNIQSKHVSNPTYRVSGKTDTFQNNSVYRYFDENIIKFLIKQNSELSYMLASNKIPIRLNMKELEELKNGHCRDTQNVCANIVKNLPAALKKDVDIAVLKDAALLHDIGKVLIPSEILNKNNILSPKEHEIMDLHSEFGYQLLKNTQLNKKVLNLIRYHHNLSDTRNYIPDINLEILNLADKYSALTEKRVYKDAYSPQQALTILYQDVKNGVIHPQVYYALVKSVADTPSLGNIKIS